LLERDQKFEEVSSFGIELIMKFLNSVVNLEHIHKLRREQSYSGFNARAFYEYLDTSKLGYITMADIEKVLK